MASRRDQYPPCPFIGGPLDGALADSSWPTFRHGDGSAARANRRWPPEDGDSIYVRIDRPARGDTYRWVTTPAPTGRPAPRRRERIA